MWKLLVGTCISILAVSKFSKTRVRHCNCIGLFKSLVPLCNFAAHFHGLQHMFNQSCSLLLVARELYFNVKLYTDQEALSETSRYNPKFAQDGLFLIALTQRGDQRYTASPNKMNNYMYDLTGLFVRTSLLWNLIYEIYRML